VHTLYHPLAAAAAIFCGTDARGVDCRIRRNTVLHQNVSHRSRIGNASNVEPEIRQHSCGNLR
jgi:hypothetical protein